MASAAKRIPLGHAGKPEDVAEVVALLAGDAVKHMIGRLVTWRQNNVVSIMREQRKKVTR
jgi:hypothetical protein